MRKYRSHEDLPFDNTNIADKIAKQVQYAPRSLQDAFERALTLEDGLQPAKGEYLGRSPQLMQVSTSAPCQHDNLKGCIHQVNVRNSQARSHVCWKCGGLGHFQNNCKSNPKPSRW